jgi:hypothetical protein
MAINVKWDTPTKTRIRYDFIGWWTWTDMREAVRTAAEMIQTVQNPVDILVNPSHSAHLSEASLLHDHQRSQFIDPTPLGTVIVIGDSSLTNILFFIFRQIYTQGKSFLIAASLNACARHPAAT